MVWRWDGDGRDHATDGTYGYLVVVAGTRRDYIDAVVAPRSAVAGDDGVSTQSSKTAGERVLRTGSYNTTTREQGGGKAKES